MTTNAAPAPAQTKLRPPHLRSTTSRPRSRARRGHRCTRAAAGPGGRRTCCRPDHAARRLGDRGEQGQRPHRSSAGPNLCGYAVKTGEKILISMKPEGCEMDRPHSRSRQRPQLRLDDRDEGHQYAPGPGLRLRRHVLRRPDLEAGQLIRVEPATPVNYAPSAKPSKPLNLICPTSAAEHSLIKSKSATSRAPRCGA